MKVGILIVSDRATLDASYDKSGAVIQSFISNHWPQASVTKFQIVPDEHDQITKVVTEWTDPKADHVSLLLTSGGTGFGVRDITPEAIKPLLDKQASGLTTLILAKSIEITPFAALSRPICGVRNNTVIVTLPGSPKACKENLGILEKVLPHAVELTIGLSDVRHPPLSDEPQKERRSGCRCDSSTERLRQSKYPMIEYETALKKVLSEIDPLTDVETIERRDFSSRLDGYVVANDIFSHVNIPAFNSSYVDGYAVIYPHTPGEYKVQKERLYAGDSEDIMIEEGHVVRINTGSPIPKNTASIIMVEDTLVTEKSSSGQEVKLKTLVKPSLGENIRNIGSDLKQGDLLFPKGHRFDSIGVDLGILISASVSSVQVYRKALVGILSTGDEIHDYKKDSNNLASGKAWDTNRPCLEKLFQRQNYEIRDFGICPDNRQLMAQIMNMALKEVDVLITTGGVSMGEKDYIKPILEDDLNTQIHFGRVNLKPGKPTTFATCFKNGSKKYIFALPGNPVSCIVTCKLFILPLLDGLQSHLQPQQSALKNVLINKDMQLDERPEFKRALVLPELLKIIEMDDNQKSSRLLNFCNANALLRLPAGPGTLKKGSKVEAIMLW